MGRKKRDRLMLEMLATIERMHDHDLASMVAREMNDFGTLNRLIGQVFELALMKDRNVLPTTVSLHEKTA